MTPALAQYDGRSTLTGAPPFGAPSFPVAIWSPRPSNRGQRERQAIRTWQAGRDAVQSNATEQARRLQRFMLRLRFQKELDECGEPGWIDDAIPADPETIPLALDVAEQCPLDDLGDPYCSFDPDTGDALLEWRFARRRVLILTINSQRKLGYAALVGDNSYSGTKPFAGELPATVMRILQELSAQP
ncbi:hypothetical protein [Candidatus Palauibacter sp.]|uniref:hypothetical protein n=1 Tax=Candidatus Palauibacter sp. TaxID=3101350 RepID=UPI003AF22E38